MRTRRDDICGECRSRKLGCDGQVPACSQCLTSGRKCPGYQKNIVFRPPIVPTSAAPEARQRRRRPSQQAAAAAVQRAVTPEPPRPLAWSMSDVVSLCVQNFVPENETALISPSGQRRSQSRICGAWVEVLPGLLDACGGGRCEALPSAVRALGMTLIARGRYARVPVAEAIEAHCLAIRNLHRELGAAGALACDGRLVASVMCLFLSEKLLPITNRGSAVHAEGIAKLIQLRPPVFYATGVPHKLFVGFRPILIIHSLINRTSTFLSDSEWQREPYLFNPPCPLQQLLNEASVISTILETVDGLDPRLGQSELASSALRDLVRVLGRIEEWYATSELASELVLETPAGGGPGEAAREADPAVFRDVTFANALSHYCAFWITCVTNIRRLRSRFPVLLGLGAPIEGQVPESEVVTDRIVEFVLLILRIARYQVGEEMRFYGIVSASYPLHVVSETLVDYCPDGSNACMQWQAVSELISQRGYEDLFMRRDVASSL